MKNIIFIAPAGTGKGTQSSFLVNKYGYTHLSTGDLLREAVLNNDEEGKLINEYQTKGELVPDEIVYRVLKNKLVSLNGNPFILDGFPRNYEQTLVYDKMIKDLNIDLGLVIVLEIDKEEAMKRACGRLSCPNCGKGYNSYFEGMKPLKENICDDCNTSLVSRSDDNPESFIKRFEIFLNNSSKIIEHYDELGIVRRVKALNTPEKTFNEIVNILEESK